MLQLLDFDGVIVDSIDECYIVSHSTYYGHATFPFDEIEYKQAFYEFRGVVRPAWEYMSLHRALEKHFNDDGGDIEQLFHHFVGSTSKEEAEAFEKKFFFTRSILQERDFTAWVNLNPLTEFGKSLVGKANENVIIVTTKNRQATEALLSHYGIMVADIYANDEIKAAGSKGKLISQVLDKIGASSAIFVDDAVEHLDTVKDKRVQCFFVDWGYGKNSDYEVFDFEKST